MARDQLIAHLVIVLALILAYTGIVIAGNDGTPLLGVLGGYIGARSVDISFTKLRNGNGSH